MHLRSVCPSKIALCFASFSLFCLTAANAEVLKVGPDEAFATPCQAIAASSDGDVIEIDAHGAYPAEACAWNQNRLTLRGVNGRAVLKGGPETAQAEALWDIAGRGTVIENMEFSGAAAAVISRSGDLTVRNSYFHDNGQGLVVEDGAPDAAAVVENSEFAFNGHGDDDAEIAIGATGSFQLKQTFVHDAEGGSLVTSGAASNEIQGNRFSSASGGSTRQELILTAGTRAELTENVFDKAASALSPAVVQYVAARPDRNPASELIAKDNTFISGLANGAVFLDVPDEVPANLKVTGNIFFGVGAITNRDEDFSAANYRGDEAAFNDLVEHDYRLAADSAAQGSGAHAADASGFPLAARSTAGVAMESVRTSRIRAASVAGVAGITLSPNTVSGITWTFQNTLRLSAPAPAGGVQVHLAASDPSSVSVGPTVIVAQGQSAISFMVKVNAVPRTENVTISASTAGGSASAILRLAPIAVSSIVLTPSSVGGGMTSISNEIVLSGPAPSGGAVVSLSSSNPAVATVPPSVRVTAGVSSADFAITTYRVNNGASATITARYANAASAVLHVNPVQLASVIAMPSQVAGGLGINILQVNLNGPASAGGATVNLSSSNTGAVTVPQSVKIPAGSTYVTTVFATRWVSGTTVATVSASVNGSTKSVQVTVWPTQLHGLSAGASTVTGGATISGSKIVLNGPAPPGGAHVALSVSDSSVASAAATVIIPQGSTWGYFSVPTKHVSSAKSLTVRASFGGVTKTITFTVRP